MSIESLILSNHLIFCCPLLLWTSIFPSIRVFFNELALCIRWPKHWSFSISPSNEYSGLISIRIDWLDLPAVQGTLKSLLQHHKSEVSILQCLAFVLIQLSHPYMTTGKSIALTSKLFGKVISLLFNTLSRFVLSFTYLKTQLPLSLFIVWLCTGKIFTNQHGQRFWGPLKPFLGLPIREVCQLFPWSLQSFCSSGVYGITSFLVLPKIADSLLFDSLLFSVVPRCPGYASFTSAESGKKETNPSVSPLKI